MFIASAPVVVNFYQHLKMKDFNDSLPTDTSNSNFKGM